MPSTESKITPSDDSLNAEEESKDVTIANNNGKSKVNDTTFDRHSLQATMRQTVARLKQNLNHKLSRQGSWRAQPPKVTTPTASVESIRVPATAQLPGCHQNELLDDKCTIEFHCMDDDPIDAHPTFDIVELNQKQNKDVCN